MWWKQHQQEFPRLARMARQYLAVPASSESPTHFHGTHQYICHCLLAALVMIDMNGPDNGNSGRSEGANSGICQCVEALELQEEDAVKEQSGCNPTEQERTGHK
jgi:hypothetical protein